MRVSKTSDPGALGGAIANALRDHGVATLSCIGAASVNQAVKSIAVARRFLERSNLDLVCMPSFLDLQIEGQLRTTLRFDIESCEPEKP